MEASLLLVGVIRFIGQPHLCEQQIVRLGSVRVRAENQALRAEVLVGLLHFVRKPLHCQAEVETKSRQSAREKERGLEPGPFEGMSHHHIVQIRRVLLPHCRKERNTENWREAR